MARRAAKAREGPRACRARSGVAGTRSWRDVSCGTGSEPVVSWKRTARDTEGAEKAGGPDVERHAAAAA